MHKNNLAATDTEIHATTSTQLATYHCVDKFFENLRTNCNFPFLNQIKICFENFELIAGNSGLKFTYRTWFGDGYGELFAPTPSTAILLLSGVFYDVEKLSCFHVNNVSFEDYLSIRLIDKGQTDIQIGHANKLLMPGDMLVYQYPKGQDIKVKHTKNKKHQYANVYFNKNKFAEVSDSIGIPIPPVLNKLINAKDTESNLFLLERSEMLMQLIHSFWISVHDGLYRGLSMRLKVTELLYLLGGVSIDSVNYHTESINFREANVIAEIRDSLDKSYRNPPSIAFLATKSGMNRNHLCIMFKQIYGISIAQYCKTKRLELAYSLLSHDKHSVLEVSKKCGYNHVSNFIRAFASHFEITPNKLKHHILR